MMGKDEGHCCTRLRPRCVDALRATPLGCSVWFVFEDYSFSNQDSTDGIGIGEAAFFAGKPSLCDALLNVGHRLFLKLSP